MPKGHTSKLLHSRNGMLNLVKVLQHQAKIELQYEEKTTNYNEAFNKLMKIITYPNKVAGKYTIHINVLSESE